MSNDNPNPPPNRTQNRQDQDPSSSTPDSLKPKSTNTTNKSKQAEKNNQDSSSSSLLNRIQNSATGLFRDTITNPNAHALGADLGHATANGKASASSSSSTSSSRWMAGSQNYYDSVAGTSSTSPSSSRNNAAATDSNVAPPTESFRSTPNDNEFFGLETFNQEQHFQHDYGGGDDQYYQSIGKGKNRRVSISSSEEYDAAWIHAVAVAQRSNFTNNHNHDNTNNTQGYTDPKDGEEVVFILSDPSFQPGLADADDENNNFLYEDPDDAAVPAPLTADEIKILDSFRRQQSSSTTTTTHPETKAITPYSLIPDIDTFLAENDTITSSSSNSNTALRDAVLHNLPGAEDWMAVNDRYQDEVWGFLRPALEAASKEIEEEQQNDQNDSAREGPAVRRLKMILRHMQ